MRAIVGNRSSHPCARGRFGCCFRFSLVSGAAEPAPVGCAGVSRFIPIGLDDSDEYPLREPFTAPDAHRTVCKVENLDVDLVIGSAVVLIDNAYAIRYHQALSVGKAASGGKQEHISRRNGNDEIGRDQSDLTRRDDDVLSAEQIESDRARCLVARQRERRIHPSDLYSLNVLTQRLASFRGRFIDGSILTIGSIAVNSFPEFDADNPRFRPPLRLDFPVPRCNHIHRRSGAY